MRKLTSLFVLFCIPFVLLTNLALAMNYTQIGVSEAADTSEITYMSEITNVSEIIGEASEDQQCSADPFKLQPVTKTEITVPLLSDTTSETFSADDTGVDLCLPAVIVTETVLPNTPLPIRNAHRNFSSITWYPVKSPRPPSN